MGTPVTVKSTAIELTTDEAQIIKAALEQLNIKADPSAMALLIGLHDKLKPLMPKQSFLEKAKRVK